MKLTIVSGRSGSGKSACLHVLEDLGFYCVDNLPAGLLPALVEQIRSQAQVAVGIDARNLPTDLEKFDSILSELKKSILDYEIIFLDAENNILLQRFSETRRKHPLSNAQTPLKEALQRETQLLRAISELADLRLDTSYYSVPEFREIMYQRFTNQTDQGLSLLFESFGYKFGVPLDADYVFDARCLPNPYWEPALRNTTGLSEKVKLFLEQQPETKMFLEDIQNFLQKWLPHFIASNRRYMTIAVGCTGGQHRSVYLVEQLAESCRQQYKNVQVRHREL